MYTVYILHSKSTDKYYIGLTANLKDRLRRHNSGSTKSTKSGRPWSILHTEEFLKKKDAWLRERQIKK